jgi:hypothetical protein
VNHWARRQGPSRSSGASAPWLDHQAHLRLSQTLSRADWPDVVFAFHDDEEIGPRMLARLAKKTGLRPDDLLCTVNAYRPSRNRQRGRAALRRRLTLSRMTHVGRKHSSQEDRIVRMIASGPAITPMHGSEPSRASQRDADTPGNPDDIHPDIRVHIGGASKAAGDINGRARMTGSHGVSDPSGHAWDERERGHRGRSRHGSCVHQRHWLL